MNGEDLSKKVITLCFCHTRSPTHLIEIIEIICEDIDISRGGGGGEEFDDGVVHLARCACEVCYFLEMREH
jgi:hypothetical protein